MAAYVKTGLERLMNEYLGELKGRKVALCCNPTSVDRQLRHSVELLAESPEVDLVALFGPEHGIRSDAQDMISVDDVAIDTRTGLPVYSLYGHDEASLAPTQESLQGIDVMIFDIQDVGSRYYTYIYTMSYLMEAAAEAGIEVWVLDRPNPIGGHMLEGPSIDEGFFSFVGKYPIPNRHGMTAGELALYFNDVFSIGCKLKVIENVGWTREQWFDQTGLPWVLPSPNMPTLDTATVYPGGCLYEGTNLSEARGATRPFEWVGAPFLDPFALKEKLDAFGLPGVIFRPMYFRPTFHKWAHETCGAVQIHVTERDSFLPFLTGVGILHAAYQLAPQDFAWRTEVYEFVADRLAIDLLFGSPRIREAIEQGVPLDEIASSWKDAEDTFAKARAPFLLY
ncbi:MAG: hypothetical protein CL920_15160 [Deltaproteobacteria bacterium]|nr:hypothetical protein [Deltaproteobacteria bacterium]|tara:strand:+ start:4325 stop:5509 length:1185 start_codon:yes stop_codon:yes gene_type:complete